LHESSPNGPLEAKVFRATFKAPNEIVATSIRRVIGRITLARLQNNDFNERRVAMISQLKIIC
jgi:hypothetical protein